MHSRVLSPGHPDYPSGLIDLAQESPPELFVRGSLPSCPGIAVVGSRKATDAAIAFTATLVRDLAAAGYAIWSGGAIGVDATAHRVALDAGAPTVLCAPGGLDHPFPPQHADLYEQIAEHGALLSHLPDKTRVNGMGGFHRRNSFLVAGTRAVVVVAARIVSGTRSSASVARRLGRPLCVVPQAPWVEDGAGCAAELASGGAIAVTSAAHVLAAIEGGPPPALVRRIARKKARVHSLRLTLVEPSEDAPDSDASPPPLPSLPDDLEPDERALLEALGEDTLHLDAICDRARIAVSRAIPLLVGLRLRGLVDEAAPLVFSRASS